MTRVLTQLHGLLSLLLQKPEIVVCLPEHMVCQQRKNDGANLASGNSLCTRRLKIAVLLLLGLDSDTFYIYHVAAVMVDNLRRLLLGINLSDKAIMDFDFPGVGFPV